MNAKQNLDNPETILVVDDDTAMRLLMRESLEQAGLTVIEAKNGIEAISSFQEHNPDLILLDVKMPKLNGYEACSRIRQQPEGKETPIIMVTGLEDDESIQQAYDAGATDFITKPVIWSILSHRVRYLLRAGQAFKALRRDQRRLAQAQQVASLGNWEWDITHDKFYWSDELYSILGQQPKLSEISLQDCLGFVHPDDRPVVSRALDEAIIHNKDYKLDHKIIREDGTELDVEQQVEVTRNNDGVAINMYGTIQDVSERKIAERRIRQLAYYDILTGLPNRQSFNETIVREIRIAKRRGNKMALIFLDLDHFKEINDTLGHKAGDRLLQHVAEYLNKSIRASDILAKLDREDNSQSSLSRLGGDEFTILIPDLQDEETAAHVCERVLNHLKIPMRLEGQELSITGSMGIAIYPDDGEDVDSLLRHSDLAMYHAKQDGKNGFRFFTNKMNDKIKKRLSTESYLIKALENDQFVLHYEPKISVDSGKIVGVEALLRWNHPDRGLLLPEHFLDVAEESGLIIPIGEWVLDRACQTLKDWQNSQLMAFEMTVNLSSQQFKQDNLIDLIQSKLDSYRLDARYLELELTERDIVDDMQGAVTTFEKLKKMGIKLSLDNFGTGYSSLAYLKRFPIDTLKIDRSFIHDISNGSKDTSIINAIITLTQGLNLTSVGEGVETSQELEILRELGCQQVQGHMISKPLPADKIEQLLQADS